MVLFLHVSFFFARTFPVHRRTIARRLWGRSVPIARIMPTERQTAYGKLGVPLAERMHQDYPQRPVMIANPRLAPSAVSSEQALQARAMMTPEFQQNIMMSRILRTSNLYAETPRFRNQLDILA